jgi:predicted Fe-Mo cluster-binding NifX family protein
MKIAIPIASGKLCLHFGHCEQFAMVEVDESAKKVVGVEKLTPPPHEPGLLPRWLAEKGANMVIAGGMGGRAQQLFASQNISILTGAPVESPEKIAEAFLAGALQLGENTCDH